MVELFHTHRNAIISLCQRYHVKELSVFGSAARESDFTSKSDVDFLVEFDREKIRQPRLILACYLGSRVYCKEIYT